jgi:hypothetical protein
MSDTPPLNIFQRILGVMSDLHYIQKGSKTVNGSYRFVSHDQVTAAIHPLLVKYGIVTVPTVEEMIQDGNRTSVKLVTTFVNTDNPQDQFSIRSVGYGIDGGGTNKDGKLVPIGDKGPGKAISYAYKYACLKMFCLETGDDPDNDANAFYEPPKCQEFDSIIPSDLSEKDKEKLIKFLAHSSQSLKKHVEDVKREAVSRPGDFLKAFQSWDPKKKKKDEDE